MAHQQCLVCESRPRSVRLQCGHIFACAECVEQLTSCAICREPISASYNIGGGASTSSRAAAGDGGSDGRASDAHGSGGDSIYPRSTAHTGRDLLDGGGYVSSGSETYRSVGRHMCCACGHLVATFRAACCEPRVDRQELCDTCASAWSCSHCGRTSADLPRLSSGSSGSQPLASNDPSASGSSVSSASPRHAASLDQEACFYCSAPATMRFCCPDCKGPGDKVGRGTYMLCCACLLLKACRYCHRKPGEGDAVPDSDAESPELSEAANAVIGRCVEQKQNTIWEVAEGGAEKTHVALEVSRRCLEASKDNRKAVLLAPTVPIVKQHAEVAEKYHQLRICHVVGSSKVDMWELAEWTDLVEKHDLLITTPQLFLDVLDLRHLSFSAFCVLIFDECHHCTGASHPMARVIREHYFRRYPATVSAIRIRSDSGQKPCVLGMSGNLVKRKKVKDAKEREKAIKKLEKAMDSQVMPVSGASASISGT